MGVDVHESREAKGLYDWNPSGPGRGWRVDYRGRLYRIRKFAYSRDEKRRYAIAAYYREKYARNSKEAGPL